ncbi:hypothetical protein EDD15DRAFT_2386736 [Pisolithus albus]|nr:hypothetical protein EDD15DRAFT_2386736 [Pisolithus albus]
MAVPDQSPKQLVVLGAGVIGLTIAYLATVDPNDQFSVTIVARDMPEDMDSQAWASPFAGANWAPMPMGGIDPCVRRREQVTFDKFWDMIPTGLVKKLPSKVYSKRAGSPSELWWRDLVREFRILPREEIPEPYVAGVAFCTVSVNPQEYVPWLSSELRARNVEFVRKHVRTLEELRPLVGANGILVNASSLGSRSIIGVEDTKLFPIRGQSIIVHSPQLQEFLATKPGILSRITGNGRYTVLLGGTFEVGNWDTSLDMNIYEIVIRRRYWHITLACALHAKVDHGWRTEIVQLPLRGENGVLVPWNTTCLEEGEMRVVHAYGFGGAGYQTSWGVAEDVMALIKEMQACMQ